VIFSNKELNFKSPRVGRSLIPNKGNFLEVPLPTPSVRIPKNLVSKFDKSEQKFHKTISLNSNIAKRQLLRSH
jgi:hypothetical protein